ncbi:4-hydroxy-tetrahydrodipicolinate synthase [Verminephrobacter aporrectodeae subsp. tuberculatae]|uniref:4-hydroxy-tetrahydrodipicolinate synthase n=1 Tax=Verminephrobacter aporrectodeae TaxID=1110389 RepID=UPI0022385BA2|nr:4-hydroxy-tetrahydrodipicolinate synthase [Verminephrobacter aporrectodeae]MCW5220550.1 4-hydroxy-tetrahydrodipicolinate synthase [Verminephrobacter aporrectodeae subsp. tuberculatae]MCW5289846.1 4-hydroxy-tetrahydrodipicolinate synthase [Verminephrobacter aporrectodeae subsp. tuberculatae]
MNASRLRGIFPAIPTPVNADDSVNAPATEALIAYLMQRGIDGLVPLGGTGEYGALPRQERVKMVRLCARAAGGRIPVIPGVLDPGFHDALQAGKAFADAGADALMLLTPYYTTPTQAGIRDYFMRYADAAPVPILIYEIPYRTRIAIAPQVLHELSRHERIIGMKACNTDMYHFLQLSAGVSEHFALLSGEDSLLPLHMAAGASGGIVVTATLLPRTWRTIYALAATGRITQAVELHRRLIPLLNLVFAETNPGPLKSVLDLIGVTAPRVLAPLVAPAAQLQAQLRSELLRCLEVEAAWEPDLAHG